MLWNMDTLTPLGLVGNNLTPRPPAWLTPNRAGGRTWRRRRPSRSPKVRIQWIWMVDLTFNHQKLGF